ncbi:MAG: hypothetical protein KDC38_06325 [Planctomycetes bacterium]|nr:hypothetical protein [Planctomycetota bacterium]
MSPSIANFIFETVNLLLLVGALGWILFRPVRRALDAEAARRAEVEAGIAARRDAADKAATEALEARRTAEAETLAERQTILAEAEKKASAILDSATAEERSRREELEDELRIRRREESAGVAETVGRIAAESVRRLLATLDGPSLDLALVRGACVELASRGKGRADVLVESARPLEPQAVEHLERALGSRFQSRVVEELGAGVRVTTPDGQVDATAVALARRAARSILELGAPEESADSSAQGKDGAREGGST